MVTSQFRLTEDGGVHATSNEPSLLYTNLANTLDKRQDTYPYGGEDLVEPDVM